MLFTGGGGQGLAGWSEARPPQGNSNMPSPTQSLFYGSTSGIMPHSSLSSRYQSSVGQSDGMFLQQHQLPPGPGPLGGRRPAYCFLSVYTINPVERTLRSHNSHYQPGIASNFHSFVYRHTGDWYEILKTERTSLTILVSNDQIAKMSKTKFKLE